MLSGPVKTPFGYYIYEVKSITPGNQQTLAQAQASIKQQLTATQQQTALSKFVKNFKKKWPAKTECRAGYVVPDCKEYKAPKGSHRRHRRHHRRDRPLASTPAGRVGPDGSAERRPRSRCR